MHTYERVVFKLIRTPCCKHLLCWVNPRLPMYCPECGSRIFPIPGDAIIVTDDEAVLELQREAVKPLHNDD